MICGCGAALLGTALAEGFDVYTFTAPTGMQKESTSGAWRYSRVAGSAFCLYELYGASQVSGNVQQAWQSEWKNLVVDRFNSKVDPDIQPVTAKNGWQNAVGGASFQYQGHPSVAVLSTFASAHQAASLLMVGNDKKCLTDFDALLSSLTLRQPPASSPPQSSPPTSKAAVVTGFKYTSSTFDDGWVSTQYSDWVEVRRGSITVRLHYGIPYTDQTRNMGDKRAEYFWNQLVQQRYPTQALNIDQHGNLYDSFLVAQSDTTEVATGKRVHVALVVTSVAGQAYCYEIVTPDQATFLKAFPDAQSVTNMLAYNKFNVDKNDLSGTWSYGSSSGGTRYYPAMGVITYNTPISVGLTYTFRANGTYSSVYTGVVGGAATQENKQGQFTVGQWSLRLTDTAGKATDYNASFVAVRGGRILHLQDKQASAMTYDLQRKK